MVAPFGAGITQADEKFEWLQGESLKNWTGASLPQDGVERSSLPEIGYNRRALIFCGVVRFEAFAYCGA